MCVCALADIALYTNFSSSSRDHHHKVSRFFTHSRKKVMCNNIVFSWCVLGYYLTWIELVAQNFFLVAFNCMSFFLAFMKTWHSRLVQLVLFLSPFNNYYMKFETITFPQQHKTQTGGKRARVGNSKSTWHSK